MKKLILGLALCFAGVGSATAQMTGTVGSYKANDRVLKADKLMAERSIEAFQEAQQLYAEADSILQLDIAKAQADGKMDKLALLYLQNGDLHNKILSPEMTKASQGIPFDTLLFCNQIDAIITNLNTAAKYNTTPNAKGKVKENMLVTVRTKAGLMSMLTLYYNCGAFMDAMGKKQESLDYFQKFVDFPKTSVVFTPEERDSIYADAKMAPIYSTARFNLALQNFYLKNWDKTIECVDEALKTDTANVHDLYLMKINAYGEKKDSVAWQRALVEASQRTGKTTFLQNLLYYYVQSNKTQEASDLADKLVTENPQDKSAWFMKGAIELNVKKDYAAARESLGKALELDPDYEDALYNIGITYLNDIYDQRANGKFKYIGTNRNITGTGQAEYNKNKAIYEKELKTVQEYYQKAQPYFEHLRELTPNDAKRWAPLLEQVYSNLGMTEKAKEMDALLDAANKAAATN